MKSVCPFLHCSRLACFALAAVALMPETAWAQAQPSKPQPVSEPKPADWKEMDVPEPPDRLRAQAQARAMLRVGQIGDQALFDGYWRWFFAQLTKYEMRELLADDIRVDLKKQLKGRSGPAQQRVVRQIAFPIAAEIARDYEYAPLVRVNALLLLGDLNQREPDALGRGAVGLPEAAPVLLEFLDTKRPADGAVNDALRNAALNGLMNHAERGGIQDARLRNQAVTLVQQIAQEEAAPGQRPQEVHDWLRQRAQELLARLGSAPAVAAQPRR